MEPRTPEARRTALNGYCDLFEGDAALRPSAGPLPFDSVPRVGEVAWGIPFVGLMVEDELREMTNLLNQWKGALRRWDAWNRLLATRNEPLSWALQWEFVEPLVCQERASVEAGAFGSGIGSMSRQRVRPYRVRGGPPDDSVAASLRPPRKG